MFYSKQHPVKAVLGLACEHLGKKNLVVLRVTSVAIFVVIFLELLNHYAVYQGIFH